jgi:thioredoxin-related protein
LGWRTLRRALVVLSLFVAAALLGARPAVAGLPEAYSPVVLQPKALPADANGGARIEFDLTAVQQRARQEGKRLYVYLGANDCKFCRRYEAFLQQNAAALVTHFAEKYIVVDLRSSLAVTGSALFFRSGATSVSYPDFQRSIGDERARLLVYPNIWLFDAALKPLMQMPSGAGTFETVAEQIEVLHLVQ